MIDFVSTLMTDKEKSEGIYSFTKEDLFDRIINLKLTTKNTATNVAVDTYVIRSDWEMYYPDMYKVAQGSRNIKDITSGYIRRCSQKPSIKVQYKQVATGTAIEIDIFVSNFIMLASDGRTLMQFNNLTYPLGQVEIQMGYWGQFSNKPATMEELFDFRRNKNADTIVCSVSYVQTDKLPPDATLHIHGFVGTCFNPPIVSGGEYKDSYAYISNPVSISNNTNYLEDYVFTNITRRFLRLPVLDREVTYNEETGLMSVTDAKLYGVKVFFSEELESVCNKHWSNKLKKEDGTTTDVKIVGHYSESIVKALNLMRDELGIDLSFKALTDGNFIAFLADEAEDSETLAKGLQRYKLEDKDILNAGSVGANIYKNTLPAVENITTDALCTIVCPFFYFLNPFDLIKFKSRYALSGIVSYYADFTAKESKFYALYMTVSFATVDNINDCTIVCTGSVDRE